MNDIWQWLSMTDQGQGVLFLLFLGVTLGVTVIVATRKPK